MGKDKDMIAISLKNLSTKEVMVVSGGLSGEREVSLSSGRECSRALRCIGHNVKEFDYTTLDEFLSQIDIFQPDVIFNALHGSWGESGPFQGILDTIKIPYTHSGLLPSALAMNKDLTKKFLSCEGIPTPSGLLIIGKDLNATQFEMVNNYPCVVKPNDQGSSLGVSIVKSFKALSKVFELERNDFGFANETKSYIIEDYIPGRELTTAVLDNKPLGVTEIITDDFYDYKAKYEVGGSRHVIPADIPRNICELCKELAVRAHTLLGCKGVSRVDFRWNDSLGEKGLFVLEVNTQPGMTPTSLVPEQAAASGISFEELCGWMVEDASCCR